MLNTPSSEVVWRVLSTHSIRQFPLHFPLPCVTVCHHISTGVYHGVCWSVAGRLGFLFQYTSTVSRAALGKLGAFSHLYNAYRGSSVGIPRRRRRWGTISHRTDGYHDFPTNKKARAWSRQLSFISTEVNNVLIFKFPLIAPDRTLQLSLMRVLVNFLCADRHRTWNELK